jgi:hypothetical protein
MVQLTADGHTVHIDGFSLRDTPEVLYALHQPVPQAEERPT